MLSLEHIALSLLIIMVVAWFWRGLGLRDHALGQVRRHCRQVDVQLLDESIVLRRLRPGRVRRRWGIIRRYGFEFTVTGERRYSGIIELFGSRLLHIELDPHPFPGGQGSDQQTIHDSDNIRSLH